MKDKAYILRFAEKFGIKYAIDTKYVGWCMQKCGAIETIDFIDKKNHVRIVFGIDKTGQCVAHETDYMDTFTKRKVKK